MRGGRGGVFKESYFVFGEEDEVAVRVRMRSEIPFFCCRAEVSERFPSSLVIVSKTGACFRAGRTRPWMQVLFPVKGSCPASSETCADRQEAPEVSHVFTVAA